MSQPPTIGCKYDLVYGVYVSFHSPRSFSTSALVTPSIRPLYTVNHDKGKSFPLSRRLIPENDAGSLMLQAGLADSEDHYTSYEPLSPPFQAAHLVHS